MEDDSFVGLIDHDTASLQEVRQLKLSGCGITAVINVLRIAKHSTAASDVDIDAMLESASFTLRTRANDAPLAQYLASRGVAGCTGEELIPSLQSIAPHFEGEFISGHDIANLTKITGEPLIQFLVKKMQDGWIPVCTLNLQLFGNDAWHHQAIYGVDTSKRLVHCLNPVTAYEEDVAMKLMTTPSVLLVRRNDILQRLEVGEGEGGFPLPVPDDDPVYTQEEWKKLNVKEQIEAACKDESVDFVMIPANYVGGIAFFRVKK